MGNREPAKNGISLAANVLTHSILAVPALAPAPQALPKANCDGSCSVSSNYPQIPVGIPIAGAESSCMRPISALSPLAMIWLEIVLAGPDSLAAAKSCFNAFAEVPMISQLKSASNAAYEFR